MQILMGGPAAVAELVSATGASQPNVSNHLRVLREQGLVRSERRGRQAIYEIPNASVAQLVESLTAVAGGPTAPVFEPGAVAEKSGRRRFAFACPDWTERLPHLGGALGAAVCERFFEKGMVRRIEGTRAVALTGKGEHTLQEHLGLRISRVIGPDRPAGDTRQGELS